MKKDNKKIFHRKFSFIVKFCFILFWENIQTFREKRNAKKKRENFTNNTTEKLLIMI